MSVNLLQLYGQQYATNVQLLLQQKGSKLRGLVTSGMYQGEQASPVDQLGPVDMQPVTGRFQPIGRVDAEFDRRWIFPSDWDLPQLVDSFDKLRVLSDPQSSYVQNAVFGAGRKIDDLIIAAFFDDAKTGKKGETTTSFPSTQQIAVNEGAASNTGMTVAKLRAAKKLLMANEVDESDPIWCVLTSEQHDNLLGEAQIISTDYNDRPVLVDGQLKRFLGINFMTCERLQTDSNSYRRVPIWAKSGMHFGIWNDITTSIDKRIDVKGLPYQAYVYMTANATRLEEKKIVEVKCAE